jgi:hypothetical protein
VGRSAALIVASPTGVQRCSFRRLLFSTVGSSAFSVPRAFVATPCDSVPASAVNERERHRRSRVRPCQAFPFLGCAASFFGFSLMNKSPHFSPAVKSLLSLSRDMHRLARFLPEAVLSPSLVRDPIYVTGLRYGCTLERALSARYSLGVSPRDGNGSGKVYAPQSKKRRGGAGHLPDSRSCGLFRRSRSWRV